jgi:hypothetical protein
MTTPNFSGNDLGKILAFYVGRYDDKDVWVTEIKRYFVFVCLFVWLSYSSLYISTLCWLSSTQYLFAQKRYVTSHTCHIFILYEIFLNLLFPSQSQSSCWVFSFRSHIWNILWLLFELIAHSTMF